MSFASASKRRLSALIINHNSGAWALRCVESLTRAWAEEGRQSADLEVIVVDSGSEPEEATWWRSLRRAGAYVKVSPANVGYATGLNMAFELSRGNDEDVVALLNPDLHFLPGSIGPLLERLDSQPDLGAVAPRIFLDEECQLLLPPNELPTPRRDLFEKLAARYPRLARRRAEQRSQISKRFWSRTEPFEAEMLSGACLFLRRGTLRGMGEAMDGRFPLYFEDADLCARLNQLGWRLEVQPASQVLHHWSRSAGPNFEGESARRHAFGHALYMAKHCTSWACGVLHMLNAFLDRRWQGQAARAAHDLVDLGCLTESPEVSFPGAGEYVLELSLTPFWGLAGGTLVSGQSYSYPARTWSWLFPATYYLRAVSLDNGAVLGAWQFEKTSPARSWPLDSMADKDEQVSRTGELYRGERVG
ncbi:MAG: N-acetylglucosaminyl-diphospho-decaprenol L-rhamnosyltransferase [Candidatus Paceibacteria bacterium]|jgi:N-acetylglucosaminyl-diphospho-decaprenol L-rhamnosyltransferase